MKKIIQSILLFSVISTGFFFQSCCKDDGGKDDSGSSPCDNTVEVVALDPEMYRLGHFELPGPDLLGGCFTVSQTYLKVVNWDDYKNKVTPGQRYKIAYEEVDCGNGGWCGTEDARTRCGTPIIKCVKIICLQQCPIVDNCFNTVVLDQSAEIVYSSAVANGVINGHSLSTKAYYSGCSDKDKVVFELKVKEMPFKNHLNISIFEAKVNEVQNGFTCQAVFTRDACFDLRSIDNFYRDNGRVAPESVIIRFYNGENFEDITYVPGS